MFRLQHLNVNDFMNCTFVKLQDRLLIRKCVLHYDYSICLSSSLFVLFPAAFFNRQSDSSNQECSRTIVFSSGLVCAVTGS